MKFRTATSAALALTAVAAMAEGSLTFSPPGQKPTDERVNTATTGPAEPDIFTTDKAFAGQATATTAETTDANGMVVGTEQNSTGATAGVMPTETTGAAATSTATGN